MKNFQNRTLKRYFCGGLYYSGMIPILKSILKSCGIVLYFHEIFDNDDQISWCQEKSLLMHKELFQNLLEYLSRHYKLVSLDDTINSNSANTVAITFDDGFRGIYANAYPILRSIKATATIFLVTNLIGSNKLPWWDRLISQLKYFMSFSEKEKKDMVRKLSRNWQILLLKDQNLDMILAAFKVSSYEDREELIAFLNHAAPNIESHNDRIFLSIDEIKEMHSNGISFGSHTKQHPILTWLDSRNLLDELSDSKSEVQRITGAKECWFSYPDGMFSNREVKAVKEAGYIGAVKTFRTPKQYGRFAFPRISLKENKIIGYKQKLSNSMVEFSLLKFCIENYHAFR